MSSGSRINSPAGRRVLLAMSGGVDSSVAALLLCQAGYDVTGVTFSLFDVALQDQAGLVSQDAQESQNVRDARRAAHDLGIEHVVLDLSQTFSQEVVERFCCGYEHGETPNPCINCNRFVKFEALRRYSRQVGCEFIATGHYARCVFDEGTGRYLLRRATCTDKDQSYVLYRLEQDDLAHLVLPLGDLSKGEVRQLAEDAGLANAYKQESQDICFVPDGDYAAFIERRRGQTLEPGHVVDVEGNVLGTHKGLARYTIGQRKGIGIAAAEPLYVIDKVPADNVVIVGSRSLLMTYEVRAHDVTFVAGRPPDAIAEVSALNSSDDAGGRFRVSAKTSYRQQARPAWARYVRSVNGDDADDAGDDAGSDDASDGAGCTGGHADGNGAGYDNGDDARDDIGGHADGNVNDELQVIFDEPIIRPAPGQSIVLYDGDVVLGGGTISPLS